MNAAYDQLRTIFSAAGWTRFIATLRDYRDRGKPFPAVITLRDLTEEERRHHARLLRLPASSRAGALRCDLGKIMSALEAMNLAAGWDQILTLVCGTIPAGNLAAHAAKQAWQHFWPQVIESLNEAPFPLCHEWAAALRRDGTLKRLSTGETTPATHWFSTACHLLRSLPLPEETPLASAAARYCGDSHALDPAAALSTLVLRNLALREGTKVPSRSDERRELWARFGVVCDDLSAPVLSFNLGITGDTPLCRLVVHASAAAQPLHLTSRLLWASDWGRIDCPSEVFVCENPAIVALAVNLLGTRCPPLVCVSGEPKTAARLLLRAMRGRGSRLWYHGDFDWPGIAIADRVFRELGAIPWQFDASAYQNATRRQGRPLLGKPVSTPWSPELSGAMQREGFAYDEEFLAEDILCDLERHANQAGASRAGH